MVEIKSNTNEITLTKEQILGHIVAVQDYYKSQGITTALVGSFGRIISAGDDEITLINPLSGRPRDIDLICLQHPTSDKQATIFREAQQLASPLILEEHFEGKVRLVDSDAYIRYKNIEVSVDPKVFKIKRVSLCGYSIDTLDPRTMFHLTVLYGPMKPKDFLELVRFGRQLDTCPDALPEELFLPFHSLAKEIKRIYPRDVLIGKLRWFYHQKVNYQQRVTLSRLVIPLRKIIKPICGWIESPSL